MDGPQLSQKRSEKRREKQKRAGMVKSKGKEDEVELKKFQTLRGKRGVNLWAEARSGETQENGRSKRRGSPE